MKPVARYPLVCHGEGWREVAVPDPNVTYEAWRIECADPKCEGAWPPATHNHIVEPSSPLGP